MPVPQAIGTGDNIVNFTAAGLKVDGQIEIAQGGRIHTDRHIDGSVSLQTLGREPLTLTFGGRFILGKNDDTRGAYADLLEKLQPMEGSEQEVSFVRTNALTHAAKPAVYAVRSVRIREMDVEYADDSKASAQLVSWTCVLTYSKAITDPDDGSTGLPGE